MSAQDSRWDASVRRTLREELRNELIDTNRHSGDINIPDELNEKVQKVDSLFDKIVSAREAAIDSEHFRVLSEIAHKQSQAGRGELVRFDPVKYKEKLITFMGGRSADGCSMEWHSLGERAIDQVYRLAPCINFSYGALETVPVKHIVRRAATKRTGVTGVVDRPKQVQNLEQEEESTTKDVQHMLHHLKVACSGNHEGMQYQRFLVDPNSYSRTVENIFHFSFLIKEGRAGVRKGHNGLPFVFIPNEVNEVGQTTKSTNCQAIVSIDMAKWKEWIESYDITECYIPSRD